MIYGALKSIGLHPSVTAFNLFMLARSKYDWKVVEGYRTSQRQADLYAIGRNGDTGNTVTDAPPGSSAHEYRLAEDIYPTVDKGASIVLDYSHPAWAEKPNLVDEFNSLGLAGKIRTNVRLANGQTDYAHVEVADWSAHKDWLTVAATLSVAAVGLALLVKGLS